MTRILALMGSGETTPTMTGTHRDLLGRGSGSAVLLDTPYGFQENADDITARSVEYFAKSCVAEVRVASLRSAHDSALAQASALAALREAGWIFSGPGSPTYALEQWRAVGLGEVLREKLADGGVVVLSSAAALTAGTHSVPVYEIYKVGAKPFWVEGLDLMRTVGLDAVVVPHYDNAEGTNHDTRFCYLGERRLQAMEALLPDTSWVLGIDEHTAVVFDLESGTYTVTGKGRLTIRRHGTDLAVFATGTSGTIADLRKAAAGHPTGQGIETTSPATSGATSSPPIPEPPADSVLHAAQAAEQRVVRALAERNVPGVLGEILALEETLEQWASDTSTTDERDRARAIFQTLLVRLGGLAESGARDPRSVVGPFVDVALNARREARARKDWAQSDAIRDALGEAGVEVRDTAEGMTWVLHGG